jgi:hypothetical protein
VTQKALIALASLFIFSLCPGDWSQSQIEKSAFRSSQFDSFDEVWRQVSMQPWSKPDPKMPPQLQLGLPSYPGVNTADLLELMEKKFSSLFNDDADMGEWSYDGKTDFGARTRELFTNSANFKEPGVKWLHPRGVCVKGTWEITEDSPATGLFAKGTNVPMIMRLSSGTEASERYYEGDVQARIFGIAIKLFHQTDNSKEAITSNIVTLDHKGFSRSQRPNMLIKDPNEEFFFTNVAPVEGIIGSDTPLLTGAGKALSWALDMFDNPNFARPVYVTANYDDEGNKVNNAVTPFKLKFIPRFADPGKEYEDFRFELLDYQTGSFDIVISELVEGESYGDKKIGEIKMDFPMMVTHNCDQRLAFHHSPVQWKDKYEDPNLERDQLK